MKLLVNFPNYSCKIKEVLQTSLFDLKNYKINDFPRELNDYKEIENN